MQPYLDIKGSTGLNQGQTLDWMVPTSRAGTFRGLLSLSREMKVKKAETARYWSASTSEEASTNTSISIDLSLTYVSRPVTVTTQPADQQRGNTNMFDFQAVHWLNVLNTCLFHLSYSLLSDKNKMEILCYNYLITK